VEKRKIGGGGEGGKYSLFGTRKDTESAKSGRGTFIGRGFWAEAMRDGRTGQKKGASSTQRTQQEALSSKLPEVFQSRPGCSKTQRKNSEWKMTKVGLGTCNWKRRR